MNEHAPGILDRTLRRFRRAWRLGGTGSGLLKDGVAPDLPDADADRLRRQIDACLEARGGQVSARARGADLGETYLVLNPEGRRRFLEILARDYDVSTESVDAAIVARQEAEDEAELRRAESYLREALVPPRVKLLSQFNELSQGVKFLVDLRAELMMFAAEDVRLQALDSDIARFMVRLWLSGLEAHHLGDPGNASREAHRIRSRARNPILGRSQEPSR